jgi:hypothetical protein
MTYLLPADTIGWCHHCGSIQHLTDAPVLRSPYASQPTPCCIDCGSDEPWGLGVWTCGCSRCSDEPDQPTDFHCRHLPRKRRMTQKEALWCATFCHAWGLTEPCWQQTLHDCAAARCTAPQPWGHCPDHPPGPYATRPAKVPA